MRGARSSAGVGAPATEGLEATLIFNPNAGGGTPLDAEGLEALLQQVGLDAVHRPTAGPEDLDAALAEGSGLIVVAGGDGTFREVAKRVIDKDRPMALLPMGTANNSARSLGVDGPIQRLVDGLRAPKRARVDLAIARGPWGEELVVEGAGVGVFANILALYAPESGKSMLRALSAAANTLGADSPVPCRVDLDGERLDGEYLLLQVMNMRSVGPRLAFAPQADPSDGLLDLVLVRHENHDALLAYLRGLVTSGLAELPSVEIVRGRKLRVNWRGSAFHTDAISHCNEAREFETKRFSAQVEVLPGVLEVWLPGQQEE